MRGINFTRSLQEVQAYPLPVKLWVACGQQRDTVAIDYYKEISRMGRSSLGCLASTETLADRAGFFLFIPSPRKITSHDGMGMKGIGYSGTRTSCELTSVSLANAGE